MSDLPTTDENARVLLTSGRMAEAVGAYRWLIAERPDDFTLYNNMAEALRRMGLPAEALAALERADRAGGRSCHDSVQSRGAAGGAGAAG